LLGRINVCSDEKYADERALANLREHGYRVRQRIDAYVRYLRRGERRETGSVGIEPPAAA